MRARSARQKRRWRERRILSRGQGGRERGREREGEKERERKRGRRILSKGKRERTFVW